MRYVDFSGLVPKYKPQILGGKHARIAHNLDLLSGRLESFGAPVAQATMVDSGGAVFEGTARRIYKCADFYVAWEEYTFVAPDTESGAAQDAFLFVQDGGLFYQDAQRLADKLAAVKMGTCPPDRAPTTTVLADIGCRETAPNLECIDPTNPDPSCNNGDTPELRSYIFSYIRKYPGCLGRYEESAPSVPTSVDVFNGDAVSLNAGPLPAGVTGTRWYRAISGSKGLVWLQVGEVSGSSIVDGKCVGELGMPLTSEFNYPPPDCLEGVAVLGDNLTVVWSGRQMYVAQPRLPYAYNTSEHTYDFPYNIVGMRGTVASNELAQTYELHILTEGTPFTARAVNLEKVDIRQDVGRDGRLSWHPCVSKASITDLGGSTGYASPYGFVSFSGSAVDNLTEVYYSEREWAGLRPSEMTCAAWHERIFITHPTQALNRSGLALTIAPDGGTRSKQLVTHSICATAWCADPRIPLMLAYENNSQIHQWGVGAPLQWEWASEVQVQSGLWRPAAIKVVSDLPRVHHDLDEVRRAFTAWCAVNPTKAPILFFQFYHEWAYLAHQFVGPPPHVVNIYCDGYCIDTIRMPRTTKPIRIRRSNRGMEWSIHVTGYLPVREVHMQTSRSDLAQEGGAA